MHGLLWLHGQGLSKEHHQVGMTGIEVGPWLKSSDEAVYAWARLSLFERTTIIGPHETEMLHCRKYLCGRLGHDRKPPTPKSDKSVNAKSIAQTYSERQMAKYGIYVRIAINLLKRSQSFTISRLERSLVQGTIFRAQRRHRYVMHSTFPRFLLLIAAIFFELIVILYYSLTRIGCNIKI